MNLYQSIGVFANKGTVKAYVVVGLRSARKRGAYYAPWQLFGGTRKGFQAKKFIDKAVDSGNVPEKAAQKITNFVQKRIKAAPALNYLQYIHEAVSASTSTPVYAYAAPQGVAEDFIVLQVNGLEVSETKDQYKAERVAATLFMHYAEAQTKPRRSLRRFATICSTTRA
jgi:hypothetical protein